MSGAQAPLLEHAAREGNCGGGQVTLDDFVDHAVRQRLLRRDRVANKNHGHGLVHAYEPGQALGAAGPRDQPKLDLGQAEPRARGGNPKMAREREL